MQDKSRLFLLCLLANLFLFGCGAPETNSNADEITNIGQLDQNKITEDEDDSFAITTYETAASNSVKVGFDDTTLVWKSSKKLN